MDAICTDQVGYIMTNSTPHCISFDGKDYLTTKQAAAYMCLSVSAFNEYRQRYHIPVGRFGKTCVFRKSDLKLIIEKYAFNSV